MFYFTESQKQLISDAARSVDRPVVSFILRAVNLYVTLYNHQRKGHKIYIGDNRRVFKELNDL